MFHINLKESFMSKDKLWVFDTYHYLEVHAPTLEDAERKMLEVEEACGLAFHLAPDWERYQEEHAEGSR